MVVIGSPKGTERREKSGGYVLQWPIRGTFHKPQVYERVEISLVEVYERIEKSVVSLCKKAKKG